MIYSSNPIRPIQNHSVFRRVPEIRPDGVPRPLRRALMYYLPAICDLSFLIYSLLINMYLGRIHGDTLAALCLGNSLCVVFVFILRHDRRSLSCLRSVEIRYLSLVESAGK